MAEPHGYGSFDYKIINKKITSVLDERSRLNNTIQLSMPFVKATTTIDLSQVFKQGHAGDVGFTLGLHAIDQDVKYEDMFSSQDSDHPLVGYTYGEDGSTKRVYASDATDEIVAKVFDARAKLFKNTNFIRIPPPGIDQVTVGKNKNGLLASAQININVPSLVQLETLHKTFLVPGIGMVLEWGRKFAPGSTEELEEGDITDYMFPWYDRALLLPMLRKLGANKIGLKEILEDYVYPTKGQYMWMFGRVANFTVNANTDGSFRVVVKIVGPSEDSWAYSTKNTVIPPRDASTKFFCASKTNSIYTYFTETTVGQNFKTKLDDTLNPSKNSPWRKHVIKFDFGNKKAGEPKPDESKPVVSQNSFADAENAYFISWRFFVNEVLNGADHSVRSSVFGNALVDNEHELEKVGMLMPYAHGPNRQIRGDALADPTKYGYINDPYESYVGMNPHLRSVDPSTLIIINEEAVKLAQSSQQYQMVISEKDIFRDTAKSLQFKQVGLFEKSTSAVPDAAGTKDRGFLSSGVWLNHKAIVESMISADTLIRGISNLLDRMSSATNKYWNLSLDVVEPEREFDSAYNYMVVDLNFRESSDKAVSKFIDNVHIFNKYVRVDESTGELVGSELIENSVDLSLPKLMFTQIATLGLVQPDDIKAASATGDPTVDKQTEAAEEQSPKISDPNDTLRRMFAITSLEAPREDKQGPDLTIPPKTERNRLIEAQKQCSSSNTQVTAQVAGAGNRSEKPVLNENLKNKNVEELASEQSKLKETLNSEVCKKCLECEKSSPTGANTTGRTPSETNLNFNNTELNKAAAEFLAKEEGLPRGGKAYYDPPSQRNLVSIGYGHQIKDSEYRQGYIQAGDERIPIRGERGIDTVLTKEQAKKLLELDVPKYINAARAPIGFAWDKLSINQKVALTSYSYNTGSTRSLVRAGILNTIDQNDSAGTAQLIKDKGIRTANKQVLPVLVERRAREAALFARDPIGSGSRPTPTPTPVATQTITPSTNSTCTEFLRKNASECKKCKSAEMANNQIDKVLPEKQKFMVFTRQFEGMQDLFKYIEVFPDFMTAEITGTADGNVANAFGSSPGALSIKADFTMPGINGLRVGELFWMDRIPSFYKAFGAFQIMSIEDSLTVDGWKTKVHAQFNYLGTKWKESMATRLERAGV